MNRQAIIPMFASCMPNCAACAATNSWSRVASRGLLGSLSLPTPSFVRKSVHPLALAIRSPPSAINRNRLMAIVLTSAVEVHGKHERARLRHVEVVHAARVLNRATQIGLGIVARVVRPRLQVAPGHPQIEAR